MSDPTNLPYAFVAKMVAKPDQAGALGELLTGALASANDEAGTVVWFAVRTDESTFWIFDAFANEDDRNAHASGAIVAALGQHAEQLLAEAPQILPADVLASKMP